MNGPFRPRLVEKRAEEHQPSDRLRAHTGFRVAVECYDAAIAAGCDHRIEAAIWDIVMRERPLAEAHLDKLAAEARTRA